MEYMFRTGVLDTQTENALEDIMETPVGNPAGKVTAAGVRKLLKGSMSDAAAARVADCINEVLQSESQPPAQMSTEAFAQAVLDALPGIGPDPDADDRARGRFGPHKVFIAAVWRRLSADPRFAGMTEAQFKRRLVDANREGLLELARADLVGAMNQREIMASEIRDLGSEFHFVLDRAELRRRGW